jgi:hypothetical protein
MSAESVIKKLQKIAGEKEVKRSENKPKKKEEMKSLRKT